MDPEHGWAVKLDSMRAAANSKTRAILVSNPSNPCGNNMSREEVRGIVELANELRIPLISDEVFYGLSYEGEYISFTEFNQTVPMICLGSLSKVHYVPGWRCGWIIVYNTHGYFDLVVENLSKQQKILLHPASFVQAVVPAILELPSHYLDTMKTKLRDSARLVFE